MNVFLFFSILFAIIQALDGIFTYVGIINLGLDAEGNPAVRFFIEKLGPFWGLLFVKTFAILFIAFLYRNGSDKKTLQKFFVCFCFLYIIFAILPWVYILVSRGLLFTKHTQ